jgi:hypothetical protein
MVKKDIILLRMRKTAEMKYFWKNSIYPNEYFLSEILKSAETAKANRKQKEMV